MFLIPLFCTYIVKTVLLGLFGRYLSLSLVQTLFFFFFSFLSVVFCISFGKVDYFSLVKLIESGVFSISRTFRIDNLSFFMTGLIFFISELVQFYTLYYYIKFDPFLYRFLSLLNIFTLFILMLVNAADLLTFFIGWEGVGLVSFLLISFWSTRVLAIKAGLKAIYYNKIGDVFFFFAIRFTLIKVGTLDFFILRELSAFLPFLFGGQIVGNMIVFCFLVGVFRKSAQIGFHGWLTDAIEGPTPVSALLHAATIVTAGVFFVVRCSWFFEFFIGRKVFLFCVAVLTVFMSGFFSIVEQDIKKIVALSTCNHLGLRLVLCSLSAYNVCFFHLVNHAFSKALLFLSSGIIIHTWRDEQDIRQFYNLKKFIPLLFWFFFFSTVSLVGFLVCGSFYSKELIFSIGQIQIYLFVSGFLFVLYTCIIFFTLRYTDRILSIFVRDSYSNFVRNISRVKFFRVMNKIGVEYLVLFVLTFFSFFVPIVLFDLVVVLDITGTGYFNLIVAEFLPHWLKLIPIWLVLFIGVSYKIIFVKKIGFLNWYSNFLNNFWRSNLVTLGLKIFKYLDKGAYSFFSLDLAKWVYFKRPTHLTQKYTGSIYGLVLIIYFFCFFGFYCVELLNEDWIVLSITVPVYGYLGAPKKVLRSEITRNRDVLEAYKLILKFEKKIKPFFFKLSTFLYMLDAKSSKFEQLCFLVFKQYGRSAVLDLFMKEHDELGLKKFSCEFRWMKRDFEDRVFLNIELKLPDVYNRELQNFYIALYLNSVYDDKHSLGGRISFWGWGISINRVLGYMVPNYWNFFFEFCKFWSSHENICKKNGLLYRKETAEIIYKWFHRYENETTGFRRFSETRKLMCKRILNIYTGLYKGNYLFLFRGFGASKGDDNSRDRAGSWVMSDKFSRFFFILLTYRNELLWLLVYSWSEDITKFTELYKKYSSVLKEFNTFLGNKDGSNMCTLDFFSVEKKKLREMCLEFFFCFNFFLEGLRQCRFIAKSLDHLRYEVEVNFGSKRPDVGDAHFEWSKNFVRILDFSAVVYRERYKINFEKLCKIYSFEDLK